MCLEMGIYVILSLSITLPLFVIFTLCSYYWRGQYQSKLCRTSRPELKKVNEKEAQEKQG